MQCLLVMRFFSQFILTKTLVFLWTSGPFLYKQRHILYNVDQFFFLNSIWIMLLVWTYFCHTFYLNEIPIVNSSNIILLCNLFTLSWYVQRPCDVFRSIHLSVTLSDHVGQYWMIEAILKEKRKKKVYVSLNPFFF